MMLTGLRNLLRKGNNIFSTLNYKTYLLDACLSLLPTHCCLTHFPLPFHFGRSVFHCVHARNSRHQFLCNLPLSRNSVINITARIKLTNSSRSWLCTCLLQHVNVETNEGKVEGYLHPGRTTAALRVWTADKRSMRGYLRLFVVHNKQAIAWYILTRAEAANI